MFGYSFSIGDSVDGFIRKTKVRGVVDGVFFHQGLIYVKVFVVRSAGPEKLTGKVVEIPEGQIIKISEERPLSDGEILNFIDMALIEKNEEWFNELVTLLNTKNRPPRSSLKLY